MLNDKLCRSRSFGLWRSIFHRSQLIWFYTVCRGKEYPGSARSGLKFWFYFRKIKTKTASSQKRQSERPDQRSAYSVSFNQHNLHSSTGTLVSNRDTYLNPHVAGGQLNTSASEYCEIGEVQSFHETDYEWLDSELPFEDTEYSHIDTSISSKCASIVSDLSSPVGSSLVCQPETSMENTILPVPECSYQDEYLHPVIWTAMREKVLLDMCAKWRFRSAGAFA